MDGMPMIPGYKFSNPTQSKFHRSHSLTYKNGYSQATRPNRGIGGQPINYNQLSDAELDELAHYKPTLTYGQAKTAPPSGFIPAHVVWDKKVLKFDAWYQQTVNESPAEHYRVRHVNIYYYLEDDSIAVNEPEVENSGLPQGRLIKRQRVPKNDVGDNYTWKDINNGVNVTFYGKIFHVYDCDKWTRDFLESEGIEVNPAESCPVDPYVTKRQTSAALKTYKAPSDFDKLKQFIDMDRKVLRFYAIWDDRDNMFGELRKFIIHYYLVDDTLEVREMHSPNDGHDPFPLLINRHRVPKDRYGVKSTFPAITLELSPQEISQYFSPADFGIGKTVDIYNRRFFIFDIDNFTKAFYWKTFGLTDFTPIDVELQHKPLPKMDVAPYTGPGAVDDTMQSTLSLMPQPPKKDVVKMLGNEGRVLRYEAVLESDSPHEKGRRFVISYRLNDDMVTIFEPPTKNSGIISGKFLERSRVCKPGSTPEQPQFYGPQDFYIGATVEVFRRKFTIVNADLYVLTYMEEHPELFPRSLIDNMRSRMQVQDKRTAALENLTSTTKYNPVDIDRIVGEVKRQLKKLAITANNRIDKIFLGINIDRQGYVTKQNLQQICARHYLPCDSAVIDRIACDMCPSDPDHISLEELRQFLESS